MDRTGPFPIVHREAMSTPRSAPCQFVLRTSGRNGREFAVHAAHRRGIHAASLLWDAAHDRMAQTGRVPRQSETSEPFDAAHGAGGDLPRPSIEPGRRIEEIPVFIGEFEDRPPQSGVVHGHNLHSTKNGIRVFDSGDGLVQPLRVVLETVDEFGGGILPGSPGRGSEAWASEDFQQRSRCPIYQPGLYRSVGKRERANQYGWTGPRVRQYHDRTAVAKRQIRRGLFKGLRNGERVPGGIVGVLEPLQ